MIIGLIGTREFDAQPEALRAVYVAYAVQCGARGWTIKTGAAPGSDQQAVIMSNGAPVHLILPWASYEQAWRDAIEVLIPFDLTVYDPRVHQRWTDSVQQFHPNPRALTRGARALHARNYGIIEGTDAVIGLPSYPEGGGTAQGLRIGRALGIPTFNLQRPEERDALAQWWRSA